jgi:hypothetical protein
MYTLAVTILIGLTLGADPPPAKRNSDDTTPRKPHPLAPSLPETTKAEEDKFDEIIDRFIDADTGKLKGPEAKKAMEEFQKLPPESAFALVRGLNKAAAIDHSCPALVIAKKLAVQMRSSTDKQLLQYARENVGAGLTQSRHAAVIKDLRLGCALRISAIGNQKPAVLKDP